MERYVHPSYNSFVQTSAVFNRHLVAQDTHGHVFTMRFLIQITRSYTDIIIGM